MSASFPSSVKSFSTKLAAQTIAAAHVNDLQDEVVAIETALITGPITLGTVTTGAITTGAATTGTISTGAATLASVTVTGAATLTGGQIVFPATQVPSAGANTLDDYEEGTWTPSLGGTATYTARTGTYTKIGRQVTVHGVITVNAIGSGSVGIITGLPFTPSATVAGSVGLFASAASSIVFAACYADNTPRIVITGLTAAGASMSEPVSMFGNSTSCYFTCTYFV